jgi:cysteine synthase A
MRPRRRPPDRRGGGANVWAARQLARKVKGNVATILPDRAERYFSTALL